MLPMNCDHLLGMGRTTVRQNGEVVATWLTEIRKKDLPMDWDGLRFSFCPVCGEDVRKLTTLPTLEYGYPAQRTGGEP